MRAGKHQSIDVLLNERLKVGFENELCRRMIDPILFDDRHQQGRRLRVNDQTRALQCQGMLIRMRTNGSTRGNDPYPPGCRIAQRRFDAGLDHADNGQIKIFPQHRQGMRGGGVAGDDDGLDPALDQKLRILLRKTPDRFRAFRAVGQTRGIAEVQDVLARQQILHRTHHGEASHSRIKKSQWRRVHAPDLAHSTPSDKTEARLQLPNILKLRKSSEMRHPCADATQPASRSMPFAHGPCPHGSNRHPREISPSSDPSAAPPEF